MEEEKDNKGLKVGIIIFLIICLIGILYFMFKMTYVGDKKTNNESNENKQNSEEKTTLSSLTNISCFYDITNKTYNEECEKYKASSLNEQYNLPKEHKISKLITSDDNIEYLILTNGYEKGDENYHEYLFTIQEKEKSLETDKYKNIAGIYRNSTITNVILYNETNATKFEFKKINLNDNSVVKEANYPLSNTESGFTNPIIVSKNNKTYIVLTLASEYTDRLILTTDFERIDKGLAYDGYELTEEGNIKIFVESHKYKIYDDTGKFISEGEY